MIWFLQQLPTSDLEVLSAGVTALGGQWRTGLTKDVTHLFAMSPSSVKYATALHYQEHTKVKVLLPHWFDDAVRLGLGMLDTAPYEWPEPLILRGPGALTSSGGDKEKEKEESIKKAMRKLDADKEALYRTATDWTPDATSPTLPMPSSPSIMSASPIDAGMRNVWQGRRVLLSSTLGLVARRRETLEAGIVRAGGVIVSWDEREGMRQGKAMEVEKVEECDVFVTRFKSGKAYVKVRAPLCPIRVHLRLSLNLVTYSHLTGHTGSQNHWHTSMVVSSTSNGRALLAHEPTSVVSHSTEAHRRVLRTRKSVHSLSSN